MARIHRQSLAGDPNLSERAVNQDGQRRKNIFFRALVDLGTGGVAGIEATRVRTSRRDVLFPHLYGPMDRIVSPTQDAFGAWGSVVREPAAYLVRGELAALPGRIGETLGIAAERIILMYDLAALFREPARAQEALVAAKRAGARILLDIDDLDDPPARFLEMLPADILRVAPGRMPWHWDAPRRREAMVALLHFAENLLMDVAVEGVAGREKRRELLRLGVRYVQGGWRRDTRGLVPDPGRS